MTQAAIVGAGPAGAALALLLAQRGIRVTLIEASRSFQRSLRGEGLMPSGLEALEQMGLSPVLQQIPHRALDAWEFLIDNCFLFRVDEPIAPHEPPCTLVSQPALLEALIDRASQYPNFEFVQNTPVQDLLWAEQRVVGVQLGGDAPEQKLRQRQLSADVVIAADGRNSIMRQRAGLVLEQQSAPFNILWLKLPDAPRFEAENVFYSIVRDRHAFGLFRSSAGSLQVGWSLRDDDPIDWKQVDWAEQLASTSPPWLAEHVRAQADPIDRPVLLSVVVGRCPRWSVPGLLLIGDAAHPMSPIRAQGINMALRDVIVAANHLVPLLRERAEWAAIDAALPQIQAEREPEIVKAQQLQAEEAAQAERLRNSALLRWGASRLAPLLRWGVRRSWIDRQRQLRQGVTSVRLTV